MIDALHKRYSKKQDKAAESLDWYCWKTLVRRVAKYVPMHGEKGQLLMATVAQDSEISDIPDGEITPLSGEVASISEHLILAPRRAEARRA